MRTRDIAALLGAGALACGGAETKTVETKTVETKAVETKTVETTRVEKVEPTKPDDAPATPTVARSGPGSMGEDVLPAGVELDGRKVVAAAEGPWERRTAVGEPGLRPSPDAAAPGGAPSAMEREGGGGGIGGFDGAASGGSPAKRKGGGGPVQQPPKDADSGPLRAGATDDNADFKGFLEFLNGWASKPGVAGRFQPLDVRDRVFVRVLDGDGRPVPGAAIRIEDAAAKRELWRARTYGDGRAPFYPRVWGDQMQSSGSYAVTATVDGQALAATWDGKAELVLRAPGPRAATPTTLEVLFLIDTTGSMGDEIAQIKSTLLSVTGKIQKRHGDLQLRYGSVLYRDVGDDYLTMAYPFTADIAAFDAALQAVEAGGGGDLPEALNQGLDRAVAGMKWQPDAAKVVFLICDAPPQMRHKGDVLYGDSAVQAVARGIRIHAVAASGLDELGTLVLRQLAQFTRGKFIFIEYGSAAASAAQHGVGGQVQSNNLDDIIAREIAAEVEGWGE